MKIDLDEYSSEHKLYAFKWYKEKEFIDPCLAVSPIAVMSSVPCIVIAYWLGEMLQYPDALKTKVDMLMKFYDCKEILNKPLDCPWS